MFKNLINLLNGPDTIKTQASEIARLKDNCYTRDKTISDLREQSDGWRNLCTESIAERAKLISGVERLSSQIVTLESDLVLSRSENAELRNGIGHLLHGMAAVQSLVDGFVTRINMIPKFFGLGEPLAHRILEEFATKQKNKGKATEEPDEEEEPDDEDKTGKAKHTPDDPKTTPEVFIYHRSTRIKENVEI